MTQPPPLTHACPMCDGDPATTADPRFCVCHGVGAVTATEAASWAAEGVAVRALPPVPKRLARPCVGCAFRRGSPEREDMHGTWTSIAEGLAEARPFRCHVGMPVDARGRYVPRAGIVDGQPVGAPICAGWATARRRLARGLPLLQALRPVGRAQCDKEAGGPPR